MSRPRRYSKAENIAWILSLPVVLPLVCVLCLVGAGYERCTGRELQVLRSDYPEHKGRPRQKRYRAYRRVIKTEVPKPLPAERKRALTPPLPCPVKSSSKVPQETSQQENSFFCTQLPLEIRSMIYNHVLTSDQNALHIYRRADRRLGQYRCDLKHFGCFEEARNRKSVYSQLYYYYDEPFYTASGALKSTATFRYRARKLLSLLQTCRRVYSETINLLYSGNIFSFDDNDAMSYFSRTVLPQRLNSIRRVQILWSDYGWEKKEPCKALLKVLNKMGGLREVELVTLDPWPAHVESSLRQSIDDRDFTFTISRRISENDSEARAHR